MTSDGNASLKRFYVLLLSRYYPGVPALTMCVPAKQYFEATGVRYVEVVKKQEGVLVNPTHNISDLNPYNLQTIDTTDSFALKIIGD